MERPPRLAVPEPFDMAINMEGTPMRAKKVKTITLRPQGADLRTWFLWRRGSLRGWSR